MNCSPAPIYVQHCPTTYITRTQYTCHVAYFKHILRISDFQANSARYRTKLAPESLSSSNTAYSNKIKPTIVSPRKIL